MPQIRTNSNPYSWRKGNPQSTFPKLKSGTDSSVKTNVSSFISELIIGYGVELKFNLSAQVTQTIDNVVRTNSKSDGGLSVFGALYSNSSMCNSFFRVPETWIFAGPVLLIGTRR